MVINVNNHLIASRSLPTGEFYGQMLSSRITDDFFLGEIVYDKGLSLPKHSHELPFFCLLLEGCGEGYYPRKAVCHEPFTISFHPPDESHRMEIGNSGARVLVIEILPALLKRLGEHASISGINNEVGGGELLWLGARLLREHRDDNACASLAIEGLILEMLAVIARIKDDKEKGVPSWVVRVTELIHAEFKQSLTMNYLSA